MLTTRGLGVVLADLSQMGFDAKWGVVSAADVGAPHLRERIWILATDTSFQRCNEWGGDWKERQLLHDINRDASESKPERERWQRGIGEIGSDVANSCDKGLQGSKQFQNDIGENIRGQTIPHGSITKRNNDEGTSSNWWDIEPNVGRVANGVAARVDRLKAIGNGQVPLCAATAWELLK
jgi:DNA (cytosine-5)-methyltransferase 1